MHETAAAAATSENKFHCTVACCIIVQIAKFCCQWIRVDSVENPGFLWVYLHTSSSRIFDMSRDCCQGNGQRECELKGPVVISLSHSPAWSSGMPPRLPKQNLPIYRVHASTLAKAEFTYLYSACLHACQSRMYLFIECTWSPAVALLPWQPNLFCLY